MGTINIILFLVGAVNLVLGLFVYLKYKIGKANRMYALAALFVASWTFVTALFRESQSPNIASFLAVGIYLSGAFIAWSFLYFSFFFPYQKIHLSKLHHFLLFLPNIFIFGILYFSDWHIKEIILKPEGNQVILNPGYFFYFGYFMVYMGWGFLNLWTKFKESTGIIKLQIKYVLAGVLIASLTSFIFSLILPWMGIFKLVWISHFSTLLMIVAFAYAIAKHHLMHIRVIATELFSVIIVLLFFINTALSKSIEELLARAALLFFVIIFSIFLVRGTLREVESLRRLSQAKSEFISIVSHQLRTPLTAIKGYISMVLEGSTGKISPKSKSALKNVYQSNERLIKLVNDILDISRIEAGKMEVDFKKISLEDIISSVVDELKIEAKKKNLRLIWEKPEEPSPKILADRDKLRQVILNIVDNALRYTNEGGVTIKLKTQNSKLKTIVKDTGEGMTKDEIGHLFESFSRGKAGTRFWTEGVGLGLYVAKRFVEMHDGKIWAESKGKGKGSTFYIELPIK